MMISCIILDRLRKCYCFIDLDKNLSKLDIVGLPLKMRVQVYLKTLQI